MKAIKIKNDVYWTGVRDWGLTNFHGHLTPMHSTYNSYVVLDDNIAIIDGAKKELSAEMIERVKSITDLSKVSYLVVNHVEMDHSGNIPELMKLAPQIKIITDNAGKMALSEHYDTDGWEFIIVKAGDEISLGKKTLSFVPTPMLHWPDSMVTYLKEDKILFSNDAFGQHICVDTVFVKDLSLDVLLNEAKRYYANILTPYGVQAQGAIKKLGEFDIEIIAPSHGCIWGNKKEIKIIIDAYLKWSSHENAGSALVVYDTMWGSTAKLADAVKSSFEDLGIPVVKRCLSDVHYSDIVLDLLDAKYIAVGSPTLNNQMYPSVAQFLTYIKGLGFKDKTSFYFGSYGWKPGVVDSMSEFMCNLGWETIDSFAVKYNPKSEGLDSIKKHVKNHIRLSKTKG